MLKPILWRRTPPVWVMTPDGTMVSVDADTPRFVREVDYTDTVEAYETDLRQARHSAAEVSQREARWMMIEQRLKKTISDRCGFVVPNSELCTCPRCLFAREVWEILNSDPPVGAGFVSEQSGLKAGTM